MIEWGICSWCGRISDGERETGLVKAEIGEDGCETGLVEEWL